MDVIKKKYAELLATDRPFLIEAADGSGQVVEPVIAEAMGEMISSFIEGTESEQGCEQALRDFDRETFDALSAEGRQEVVALRHGSVVEFAMPSFEVAKAVAERYADLLQAEDTEAAFTDDASDLATERDLPRVFYERLVTNEDKWVRVNLAENPAVPVDLLSRLASDEDWSVRFALTENPATSVDILRVLAADEDEELREAAEERLTAL